MYGLVTPNEEGVDTPAKKPTWFLSSSWCILDELSLCCNGAHVHQHLMSGRAAAAALYPPALYKAICRGLAKQRSYDDSGLAGGQRFGRKELKAMLKKLDQINGDIEGIHKFNDNSKLDDNSSGYDNYDYNDETLTHGSQ